jgi:hypothetical protein
MRRTNNNIINVSIAISYYLHNGLSSKLKSTGTRRKEHGGTQPHIIGENGDSVFFTKPGAYFPDRFTESRMGMYCIGYIFGRKPCLFRQNEFMDDLGRPRADDMRTRDPPFPVG